MQDEFNVDVQRDLLGVVAELVVAAAWQQVQPPQPQQGEAAQAQQARPPPQHAAAAHEAEGATPDDQAATFSLLMEWFAQRKQQLLADAEQAGVSRGELAWFRAPPPCVMATAAGQQPAPDEQQQRQQQPAAQPPQPQPQLQQQQPCWPRAIAAAQQLLKLTVVVCSQQADWLRQRWTALLLRTAGCGDPALRQQLLGELRHYSEALQKVRAEGAEAMRLETLLQLQSLALLRWVLLQQQAGGAPPAAVMQQLAGHIEAALITGRAGRFGTVAGQAQQDSAILEALEQSCTDALERACLQQERSRSEAARKLAHQQACMHRRLARRLQRRPEAVLQGQAAEFQGDACYVAAALQQGPDSPWWDREWEAAKQGFVAQQHTVTLGQLADGSQAVQRNIVGLAAGKAVQAGEILPISVASEKDQNLKICAGVATAYPCRRLR